MLTSGFISIICIWNLDNPRNSDKLIVATTLLVSNPDNHYNHKIAAVRTINPIY